MGGGNADWKMSGSSWRMMRDLIPVTAGHARALSVSVCVRACVKGLNHLCELPSGCLVSGGDCSRLFTRPSDESLMCQSDTHCIMRLHVHICSFTTNIGTFFFNNALTAKKPISEKGTEPPPL